MTRAVPPFFPVDQDQNRALDCHSLWHGHGNGDQSGPAYWREVRVFGLQLRKDFPLCARARLAPYPDSLNGESERTRFRHRL
jgi:hypothetical protein